MAESGIYVGTVRHFRFKPVRHKFSYRVYSFLLDIDQIDRLATNARWFSRSRFNLFSFYDRDHGHGQPDDIGVWVRSQLRAADIVYDGQILMLCYPRVLGYAFNPITVYYCFNQNEELAAILYAVRNTFGGRHSYLFPVDPCARSIEQHTNKLLHVSPFIDMDMRYHFSLAVPGKRLGLAIKVSDRDGPLLNTSFGGDFEPFTDKALVKCFFSHPLVTLKVVAGIHFEAVKLLLKGLRLKPGAPDPTNRVTVIR